MINTTLINPKQPMPYADDTKQGVRLESRRRQPLDLAYCASVLEKNNLSVDIIDANIMRLNNDKVVKIIKTQKPRLVVINTSPLDRWQCPYLNIDASKRLAFKIKESLPKTIIAFIGPHGTTTPNWVFDNCPSVDILVRGEPEHTVLELTRRIKDSEDIYNVRGTSIIDHGVITHNPDRPLISDLDSLPYPAYHLLPMDRYDDKVVDGITPFSLMLSSRGCPNRCTFCLRTMYGDKYRYRSPKNIVDELEYLMNNYGVRAVYFQDLEFCVVKKRVYGICDEIINRNLDIKWACSARIDNVDEELLKSMKNAGCTTIFFGLESGSQKVLNTSKKRINLENASKVSLFFCDFL